MPRQKRYKGQIYDIPDGYDLFEYDDGSVRVEPDSGAAPAPKPSVLEGTATKDAEQERLRILMDKNRESARQKLAAPPETYITPTDFSKPTNPTWFDKQVEKGSVPARAAELLAAGAGSFGAAGGLANAVNPLNVALSHGREAVRSLRTGEEFKRPELTGGIDAYLDSLAANEAIYGDTARAMRSLPGGGQVAMETLLPGEQTGLLGVAKQTGSLVGDLATDPSTLATGGPKALGSFVSRGVQLLKRGESAAGLKMLTRAAALAETTAGAAVGYIPDIVESSAKQYGAALDKAAKGEATTIGGLQAPVVETLGAILPGLFGALMANGLKNEAAELKELLRPKSKTGGILEGFSVKPGEREAETLRGKSIDEALGDEAEPGVPADTSPEAAARLEETTEALAARIKQTLAERGEARDAELPEPEGVIEQGEASAHPRSLPGIDELRAQLGPAFNNRLKAGDPQGAATLVKGLIQHIDDVAKDVKPGSPVHVEMMARREKAVAALAAVEAKIPKGMAPQATEKTWQGPPTREQALKAKQEELQAVQQAERPVPSPPASQVVPKGPVTRGTSPGSRTSREATHTIYSETGEPTAVRRKRTVKGGYYTKDGGLVRISPEAEAKLRAGQRAEVEELVPDVETGTAKVTRGSAFDQFQAVAKLLDKEAGRPEDVAKAERMVKQFSDLHPREKHTIWKLYNGEYTKQEVKDFIRENIPDIDKWEDVSRRGEQRGELPLAGDRPLNERPETHRFEQTRDRYGLIPEGKTKETEHVFTPRETTTFVGKREIGPEDIRTRKGKKGEEVWDRQVEVEEVGELGRGKRRVVARSELVKGAKGYEATPEDFRARQDWEEEFTGEGIEKAQGGPDDARGSVTSKEKVALGEGARTGASFPTRTPHTPEQRAKLEAEYEQAKRRLAQTYGPAHPGAKFYKGKLVYAGPKKNIPQKGRAIPPAERVDEKGQTHLADPDSPEWKAYVDARKNLDRLRAELDKSDAMAKTPRSLGQRVTGETPVGKPVLAPKGAPPPREAGEESSTVPITDRPKSEEAVVGALMERQAERRATFEARKAGTPPPKEGTIERGEASAAPLRGTPPPREEPSGLRQRDATKKLFKNFKTFFEKHNIKVAPAGKEGTRLRLSKQILELAPDDTPGLVKAVSELAVARKRVSDEDNWFGNLSGLVGHAIRTHPFASRVKTNLDKRVVARQVANQIVYNELVAGLKDGGYISPGMARDLQGRKIWRVTGAIGTADLEIERSVVEMLVRDPSTIDFVTEGAAEGIFRAIGGEYAGYGNQGIPMSFDERYRNDPQFKDVMDKLADDPDFALGGSLSLAVQGQLGRPGGVGHDLDFNTSLPPKKLRARLREIFGGDVEIVNDAPLKSSFEDESPNHIVTIRLPKRTVPLEGRTLLGGKELEFEEFDIKPEQLKALQEATQRPRDFEEADYEGDDKFVFNRWVPGKDEGLLVDFFYNPALSKDQPFLRTKTESGKTLHVVPYNQLLSTKYQFMRKKDIGDIGTFKARPELKEQVSKYPDTEDQTFSAAKQGAGAPPPAKATRGQVAYSTQQRATGDRIIQHFRSLTKYGAINPPKVRWDPKRAGVLLGEILDNTGRVSGHFEVHLDQKAITVDPKDFAENYHGDPAAYGFHGMTHTVRVGASKGATYFDRAAVIELAEGVSMAKFHHELFHTAMQLAGFTKPEIDVFLMHQARSFEAAFKKAQAGTLRGDSVEAQYVRQLVKDGLDPKDLHDADGNLTDKGNQVLMEYGTRGYETYVKERAKLEEATGPVDKLYQGVKRAFTAIRDAFWPNDARRQEMVARHMYEQVRTGKIWSARRGPAAKMRMVLAMHNKYRDLTEKVRSQGNKDRAKKLAMIQSQAMQDMVGDPMAHTRATAEQLLVMEGEREWVHIPPGVASKMQALVRAGDIEALYRRINANRGLKPHDKMRLAHAIKNMVPGQLLAARPMERAQIEELRRLVGDDPLIKAALDARDKKMGWFDLALHAAGVGNEAAKAIKASYDFSAPRQALWQILSHPIHSKNAFKDMMRVAFARDAEGTAEALSKAMYNDPMFDTMKTLGLKLYNDYRGDMFRNRADQFSGGGADLARKILPGIARSDALFSAFLDRVKFDTAKNNFAWLAKQGVTPERHLDVYKAMVDYINISTGHGGFEALKDPAKGSAAAAWNKVAHHAFWSPSFLYSRMQLANPRNFMRGTKRFSLTEGIGGKAAGEGRSRWYVETGDKKISNIVVAKAQADALRAVAAMTGMVALGVATQAALGHDEAWPEWNLISKDAGKLKFGKDSSWRADTLGGFQQYMVLAARVATGMEKSGKGKIRYFGEVGATSGRMDAIAQFMAQKTTPLVSAVIAVMSGVDQGGNDTSFARLWQEAEPGEVSQWIYDTVVDSLTPMGVDDLTDIYQNTVGAEASITPLEAVLVAGMTQLGFAGTYRKKTWGSKDYYRRTPGQIIRGERMVRPFRAKNAKRDKRDWGISSAGEYMNELVGNPPPDY